MYSYWYTGFMLVTSVCNQVLLLPCNEWKDHTRYHTSGFLLGQHIDHVSCSIGDLYSLMYTSLGVDSEMTCVGSMLSDYHILSLKMPLHLLHPWPC